MNLLTRRSFLKLTAAAAVQASLPSARAAESSASGDKYVTSFYQFNQDAVRRLSYHNALPNGPRFEHIFCHSTAGIKEQGEKAKIVHAAGESFKFGWAYDAHKHRGWERASDDDLKKWAEEFRAAAFSSETPPSSMDFSLPRKRANCWV